MSVEAELKYLDVDHAALRARLSALGATCRGRYFEENLVFDDEGRSLRERGLLLRLRRTPGGAVLTVKAPCEDSSAVKLRREYETGIEDMRAMRLGLEALGYRAMFAYEKVREKWMLEGAKVCLDHLPFGDFVEIEGRAEFIPVLAERLELHDAVTTRDTYHALNRAWRERQGLDHEECFVFSGEERARLEREISG
jgi:adenylate cyclase class 2